MRMNSDLILKQNPTLKEFQIYVQHIVSERGFDQETISEIFMLFLEECGELAKAARKQTNVKSDPNSSMHNVADEAADVFMYLLDICNHYNIDLEQAFRDKEEINKTRTWK